MLRFKALYDFDAEEEGEISIKKEDVLEGTPGMEVHEGWIFVTTASGLSGFVPEGYITKIDLLELNTHNVMPDEVENVAAYDLSLRTPAKPSEPTSNVEPLSKPSAELEKEIPTSYISNNVAFTSSKFAPSTEKQATTPRAVMYASKASLSMMKPKTSSSKQPVNVPVPSIPSLTAAIDRDDLQELVKLNGQYFAKNLSNQSDTFDTLTEMLTSLRSKIDESLQASTDLAQKFTDLDEMIDADKEKWKQKSASFNPNR